MTIILPLVVSYLAGMFITGALLWLYYDNCDVSKDKYVARLALLVPVWPLMLPVLVVVLLWHAGGFLRKLVSKLWKMAELPTLKREGFIK